MTQRENVAGKQLVHLGSLTLSGVTPNATDWLDTRGFDSASLAVVTRTVTDAGAAGGFSVEIQESDTTAAASAAAVGDNQLTALETTLTVTNDGDDDKIIGAIGYLGSKRYVRAQFTGTTGTNAVVDVFGILENAAQQPPTLVGTSVAAT